MKKLFLSLFVAGALTFGLQSCGEEEVDPCEGVTCATNETCQDGTCVPNATTCDVCGTYDGMADGEVAISLLALDTMFTGLTAPTTITENAAANSYNMAVDISPLAGAPVGTVRPDVNGTLSGTTMTIENETFEYAGGAVNITINGVVEFDATFDNIIDGSRLDLTGDAVGFMTITGAKQ